MSLGERTAEQQNSRTAEQQNSSLQLSNQLCGSSNVCIAKGRESMERQLGG